MARLTILQASQQGFGSTLTIHRHIKDGTLPVYEDGDTKLLEVSDLIAVFGEPKTSIVPDDKPVAANGPADSREVGRLRSELEQAQKRNMWLQADLAEAVRSVKEKEAKFDKERERLLTVLEQAQALLLRAEGQIGPVVNAAAAQSAQRAPTGETKEADAPSAVAGAAPEEKEPVAEQASSSDDASESKDEAVSANDLNGIETLKSDGNETAGDELSPDQIVSSKMTPEQERLFAPFPETSDAEVPTEEPDQKADAESKNPMMPPLEEPPAKSTGGRALGTVTWLLLFVLAGGGYVFFEYRTKVLMSVSKILQALT